MKRCETDVVIVGSGVAGLVCALSLPEKYRVLLVTKKSLEDSNSYLAQGGICVLKDEEDREAFIEDTLKAGHYENSREAVEILVDESNSAIETLQEWGVDFQKEDGDFSYTKEGGHSTNRILYCGDYTGKSIMESLIWETKQRKNIEVLEKCSMNDLLVHEKTCYGIFAKKGETEYCIKAQVTVLATGGVGGLYEHSTNFPHIQGDGVALAIRHGIFTRDLSYVQIHPTALYEEAEGRKFLISESVRGEGAILLNQEKEQFTNELKPRDVVSKAIFEEMEKDSTSFEWLHMQTIPMDLEMRFPKIVEYLNSIGIDPYKEDVPIVPAQHYIMGGIAVTMDGETSMPRLFAVGEVACTGVHGKNRLASNSLLESVVFAKRAAKKMATLSKLQKFPNEFFVEELSIKLSTEKIRELMRIDELTKAK